MSAIPSSRFLIPEDILSQFLSVASSNISKEDGKHMETLAFAAGHFEDGFYKVTDIIFPRQLSTPFSVEDKGNNIFCIGTMSTMICNLNKCTSEVSKVFCPWAWFPDHRFMGTMISMKY